MSITEATEMDIPQLHSLVEMCYRGESSKKGWTSEADLLGGIRTNENMLTAEMNTPGAKFLKYTDEEGTISGCVYTLLVPAETKVYIGLLCVNPKIQGNTSEDTVESEYLLLWEQCRIYTSKHSLFS